MCDVSIVVPAYNAEHEVGRCLASLDAQAWDRSFEIVVVDDGSTDGTQEAVKRAATLCHRPLRLICQPNSGSGAARNRGTREAKGAVVAFCDADDVWTSCLLRKCLPFFADTSVQAVLGGFAESREGRTCEQVVAQEALRRVAEPVGCGAYRVPPPGGLKLLLAGFYLGHPDTLLIRKDVLTALGGFPEDYSTSEDLLLWMRLLNQCCLVYIASALATYFVRSGTRSRANIEQSWQDTVRIYERFREETPLCASLRRMLRRQLGTSRMSLALSRWRKGESWLRLAAYACLESPSWRHAWMLVSMAFTLPGSEG